MEATPRSSRGATIPVRAPAVAIPGYQTPAGTPGRELVRERALFRVL